MQPEITREWLAEQLALCERAKIGAIEFIQAADDAARTGYPAVLRKLMEAMDETAIIAMLKSKTMDERKAFFDLLANEFCMACGSDNPRCQCWNDE